MKNKNTEPNIHSNFPNKKKQVGVDMYINTKLYEVTAVFLLGAQIAKVAQIHPHGADQATWASWAAIQKYIL